MLPQMIYPTVPDVIPVPGPPTLTPPNIQNVVVDSNGRIWSYWNNQWN
jgi:hypothetical protein